MSSLASSWRSRGKREASRRCTMFFLCASRGWAWPSNESPPCSARVGRGNCHWKAKGLAPRSTGVRHGDDRCFSLASLAISWQKQSHWGYRGRCEVKAVAVILFSRVSGGRPRPATLVLGNSFLACSPDHLGEVIARLAEPGSNDPSPSPPTSSSSTA